jgi:hypothetical protein
MNNGDHARPIEAVHGVHAERPEPLLNHRAGARFSEAELRMRMQIPAPANHFFVIALYFFQYRHGEISCSRNLIATHGLAAAKTVSRVKRDHSCT